MSDANREWWACARSELVPPYDYDDSRAAKRRPQPLPHSPAMLRAVRFSATLEFDLDPATASAVGEMAAEIHVVSAERIAQELRRMLVDPRRRRAMELAASTGLLREVLPEFRAAQGGPLWERTLHMLHLLHEPTFELAFATLVHGIEAVPGAVTGEVPSSSAALRQSGSEGSRTAVPRPASSPSSQADRKHAGSAVWAICRRLKLSNDESDAIAHLTAHRHDLREARQMTPARLKRQLAHPLHRRLLELLRVETLAAQGDLSAVAFCEEYLRSTPREVIDPPPLMTGADLIGIGLRPGPRFKELLDAVRDAQLNGEVATRDESLELARRMAGL